MELSTLEPFFKPTAIAVIQTDSTPSNVSSRLIKNLLAGSFLGPVMPVTGRVEAVSGILSYENVDTLPLTPDLAILCSSLEEAPDYIRQLGKRGTKAVIMVGSQKRESPRHRVASLQAKILEAADAYEVRLLGPSCIGVIAPHAGLNASLGQTNARPGKVAFVTQSDSLFTTVLDWAQTREIGFSHIISLGDQLDVDFSNIIDFLGTDPMVRSILLYVESIQDARRFMSAARASARNKPILVIKPKDTVLMNVARDACELPHEDEDAVIDVAFRRSGIVRVDSIESLFDAAQNLASFKPLFGYGLAIVCNGRSVGQLTADSYCANGECLAALDEETIKELINVVGNADCSTNPVILPYDAGPEAYEKAVAQLIKDPGVGSLLVLHVPFADVSGMEAAERTARAVKKTKKTILTCWMGRESEEEERAIFTKQGVATFDTPDNAVRALHHMIAYRKNQEMLLETPDSLPTDFFPDTPGAKSIITTALSENRSVLHEEEAQQILTAYGIPVIDTRIVISAREASKAAEELGFPVALKIRSPQIQQPFDFGGVALDLATSEQVIIAAASMVARVHKLAPEAFIEGFTVQKMGRRPGAHEVFVGVFTHPVFGPVIRFGHGGMAMNMIKDSAVGLPPLNFDLARELINRTRISRLFHGGSGHKATDIDDICMALIQINQMVIDLPQITGLEINPLFVDDQGVLALGGRIWIHETDIDGQDRLAIRPYPRELEECVVLNDGRQVFIRPIRPEDAQAHFAFFKKLSSEDKRMRFFGVTKDYEFGEMAKFTQIDYDREMAFIGTSVGADGDPETLGVVRAHTRPDNSVAEFAIINRSDMKGQGLGSLLFDKMIRYCKSRGTHIMEGQTLPDNQAMIHLAEKFGFTVKKNYEDESVLMKRVLHEA